MLYNLLYAVLVFFSACIAISLLNGMAYLMWDADSNKENFFAFLAISLFPLLLLFIINMGISSNVAIFSNTNVYVAQLNMKIEELQVMNENQTTNTLIKHTVDLIDEYNNYYNDIVERIEEYSNAEDKDFIRENFDLIIYDYISSKAIFNNGNPLAQVEYAPPN